MPYRTIVIGTDGSITASMAQDTATRLAKRLRAKIILVCAYGPPRMSRALAEEVVERAVEEVRRQRVDAEPELGTGDPADLLIDVAEARKADLIVVGNKGMGKPSRFRLGSVPDRVAHYAPCDVLIVDTSKASDPDQGDRSYRKVVVGTDGSPTASDAARTGMELASLLRATVDLVFVGDPIVGAIAVEQTAASGPQGVRIEPKVVQGEPAEAICQLAEDDGADLIVVGNRGMSGARRFLLGSVPNKVAHYAPTDVLIVRTVDRSLDDLDQGQGGVFEVDGKRLAVYRDESGDLHMLSSRCTHMGCTVGWNGSEKTWDCPCHGSRYDLGGLVLQGPATKPLDPAGDGAAAPPALAPVIPAGRPVSRRGERYVVLGAGLTGGTAVATLRKEGFDGKLTLVGAEPSFPYERPPLSKAILRGEMPFEQALVNPPAFYENNQIETRFGTTVVSVDTRERQLIVAGGDPVPFDKLLIASGARNRRFPIPGLDLAGVYDLRTVEDAARIRAEMIPGARAALIGMGFIGSEVAASFRQRGIEVTVVDGGSVPLERVLGPDVGAVIAAIHRDQGVRMLFNDKVAGFEGDTRVHRVTTANGHTIECDFAVVGVGVEPVTWFLEGSGIEVDNGILVDELCHTSVAGVFAAGDVANHYHPVLDQRMRTEHWQNAIKQGEAAARSMLDSRDPYDEVHWFWSDQYDQRIEYAGFHREWDDLVVRGSLEERSFSAFYMKEGRVQAVVALNRGDDVRDAQQLIRKGGEIDPARLRDADAKLSPVSRT